MKMETVLASEALHFMKERRLWILFNNVRFMRKIFGFLIFVAFRRTVHGANSLQSGTGRNVRAHNIAASVTWEEHKPM
jgi:hypothetical protein